MVVKQVIEPILDSIFLADSYGYRPNKSALDAVGVTRERCWKYDWVLEFDIKGLFGSMSGWYGPTLASRGVGMQMMDWCTVVTSKRHRRLSLSFKLVWRSAVWRCIRRKPKSFTAETENGMASIRMSNLTFSGFASDHVWSKISETRHCSGALIR
jgi:hypothetical protein